MDERNYEIEPSNDNKETVSRRLSFVELLYGILLQPRATFRKIAETKPVLQAFLIFAGVNIITTLVGLLTIPGPQLPRSFGSEMPLEFQKFLEVFSSPAFTTMGTFFGLIFSLFMWFLIAAVLNLFAELLGGKGTGLGVLTVLGCATLPQVLAIPFEVLFYIFGIPSGLLAFISIPLFIWTQLVLPVLGIREVHKFSTGKAVLTLITPMFISFGLIITFVGTFIALMASFLG